MAQSLTSSRYPTMLSPLTIGRRKLRNRIVQAPMSVCYADSEGFVTDAVVEHYARRAAGGVAMVITENFAVNESGRQLPKQALISERAQLPGLRRLARGIQEHGALAVVQIVHSGRYSGPWQEYEMRRRLAPSAVSFPLPPDRVVTPQEISLEEIEETIVAFGRAATFAAEAGFDGVEIHGSQGFLVSSFMSSRMNQRTDEWGGSFDNRCRFALEVLRTVQEAVGDRLMIGFHLLSDELMPGGWTLEDATRFSLVLERAGIDFIMPTSTTFESQRSPHNAGLNARPGYQHDHARTIAAAVNVPVITNGRLWDPKVIESLLAAGESAAVGLARPLLADPDWLRKLAEDRADEIRVCSCNPPRCLQTQLTGAVCASWPADIQAKGYLGCGD